MAKKKILTINCEIPGGHGEYAPLSSDASLLDWDIILFYPEIYYHAYGGDSYCGKPSLSETESFRVRQQAEHWRREIHEAYEAGKTVIVFLNEVSDVYVDTGKRTYSGTGRNRQTTKIVDSFNNYRSLPLDLNPVNSKGSAMMLAKDSSIIASYWNEFGADSQYRVRIEGKVSRPLIVTKTGEKIVGGLIKGSQVRGAILLLPFLNLNEERFLKENSKGEMVWTTEGTKYGHRLLSSIIELDKCLKESASNTPTPEWAKDSRYDTVKEGELRHEILKLESKIEKLTRTRDQHIEQLKTEGQLRNLLFENGSALESAIIEALTILGFTAENYKDSDSEFDVVFSSPEGRLLGEAEGKDNKAIAIDKLRQLEMNIHEDLEREEVSEPAKAVLFGNAFRLLPIEDRIECFTAKCMSAVKRSGTALVRTHDLFPLVQYLSSGKDDAFAKKCRMAILNTEGSVVEFPRPPILGEPTIETKTEDT